MGLRDRIRALFRIFLMFTVLVAVALVSAITTIRIAIRGHQATVPNLTGVPTEKAQGVLSDLGLGMDVEDKLYSQYPADQVVSQVPASGTVIKTGQDVHVLVSLGPSQAAVPALVGTSVRAARIVALQSGLTLGDVVSVHQQGAPADQIIAQDPPHENASMRSPAVNLLVSLGDPTATYVCPSFVGRQFAAVRDELEKVQIPIGQVTPVAPGSSAPGTILGQTPLPGSKVGPEAVFTFQVSQ
jgi:eukaryotic-like serine/threonine-protein kinase